MEKIMFRGILHNTAVRFSQRSGLKELYEVSNKHKTLYEQTKYKNAILLAFVRVN